MEKKIKEIKVTIGGPCIYKTAIFEDGTESGRIHYTGQSKEAMEAELIKSAYTGRDDVRSFVNSIFAR